MPALVALKNTCLQIFDGMRGSPSQMRIAAALATAKRCNKFVILRNKGLLFHTSPRPSHRANAEPPPSSAPAPHSAVPVPRPDDHNPFGRWRGKGHFPRLLVINPASTTLLRVSSRAYGLTACAIAAKKPGGQAQGSRQWKCLPGT